MAPFLNVEFVSSWVQILINLALIGRLIGGNILTHQLIWPCRCLLIFGLKALKARAASVNRREAIN